MANRFKPFLRSYNSTNSTLYKGSFMYIFVPQDASVIDNLLSQLTKHQFQFMTCSVKHLRNTRYQAFN